MEIGFVTTNKGKLREVSAYLKPIGMEVVREDGPFIEVQADTLEEVIIEGMKHLLDSKGDARYLMKDDSGLFIDGLGGFPGVYSAYVQKTIGNKGILKLMEDVKDRKARFKTAIGLHIPGKGLELFEGEVEGRIISDMRGENGFGYDPVFIPEDETRTFAEMDTDEKNSMSHRIRAIEKMVNHLS